MFIILHSLLVELKQEFAQSRKSKKREPWFSDSADPMCHSRLTRPPSCLPRQVTSGNQNYVISKLNSLTHTYPSQRFASYLRKTMHDSPGATTGRSPFPCGNFPLTTYWLYRRFWPAPIPGPSCPVGGLQHRKIQRSKIFCWTEMTSHRVVAAGTRIFFIAFQNVGIKV